jgi:Flp pilus assembly protein TadG
MTLVIPRHYLGLSFFHALWDAPTRGIGLCRRASVSVEFVLASAPLIVLVFGFIATSAVFNTWSSMQSNAQYAARMMSTGQISNLNNGAITTTNTTATTTCSSSMRTTQVEYYACTGLPSWATFTVTSTENCAVPSVTVSLSANAATAAIADIASIFTGKTIVAQAVLMKEGSCP